MKYLKTTFALFLLLLTVSSPQVFSQNKGDTTNYKHSVLRPVPIPAGHYALIAHYADAFLSSNANAGGQRSLLAQTLMDGANDPAIADEINDFFLIDLRLPADYEAGHISEAVNVQLSDVADPGVLAILPVDKPILVICYSGHTASIATAVLCMLGYDAWTLKYGMLSWKASTPTPIWSPEVKQTITGGNYLLVTGTRPK